VAQLFGGRSLHLPGVGYEILLDGLMDDGGKIPRQVSATPPSTYMIPYQIICYDFL